MVTHWTVPYLTHGLLMLASSILALIVLPETSFIPLPEHVPGYETHVHHDSESHTDVTELRDLKQQEKSPINPVGSEKSGIESREVQNQKI